MKIYGNGDNWLVEDQLNEDLLNEIKTFFDGDTKDFHKIMHEETERYSTTGNAMQYWILHEGVYCLEPSLDKEYNQIEQKYKKEVLGRLKAAELLRESVKAELHAAWTVVGQEGSYHTVHTHGDGLVGGLSTVLYLNVPESDEDSVANEIYLVLNAKPSSRYFVDDCLNIVNVKPKDGTLLIFPPHIPHGTYPQSKGIRQTLNIEYELMHGDEENKEFSFNYS